MHRTSDASRCVSDLPALTQIKEAEEPDLGIVGYFWNQPELGQFDNVTCPLGQWPSVQ
jgi:hypothetical protein